MSSSWFSVGRMLGGLWRKPVDSVSDHVTISVQEQIDTISNNFTGDNGNIDDEDYVDNDEIDEDEWHDRELTPTKYREVTDTDESNVYFANETVCASTSYGSLASSLAAEEQPELTKAAVLMGSSPVIWRPQVTVYQVCNPIVQPTVTNITTIATTCTSTRCDSNRPTDLCDSPSMMYATSSSCSESDFDELNSEENWQRYPPIISSIPPPLPAPDWPEAEAEQRLSTLRKRIGPEMRKVWGSVHQLAHGPAAHKIKSRWKKLKKSTTSSTNSNWGLQIVQTARDAFQSGRTRTYEFRRDQLQKLRKMLVENGPKLASALNEDLRKSKMEAFLTEIGLLVNEIDDALANLKSWMKPQSAKKNLMTMFNEVKIYSDPKGVVLVISSWNYPLNITLTPTVGAIAAGNCVIMKPSELAPATASILKEMIPKYLDQECYPIILGGPKETSELLLEKFDHIMYTGSTKVGKIVYGAAQKHLTPVTLELGGKSPLYLDNTVNMDYAAKRILWGKCVNAGQTCIAPDYILCTKEVEHKFIEEAKKVLRSWFGDDTAKSPDYCRIINDNHFKRLTNLLENCEVAVGGKLDPNDKFITPTIIRNVNANHPIMQEEIFGPILPILTVESPYEAIHFINERPRPLTMYVFTKRRDVCDLFLNNTISGSICINETIIQYGVNALPFGGVGDSGIGSIHGKHSFDTFSHKKSCLSKSYNPLEETIASARYPPYSDKKLNFMQLLLGMKLNFGFLKLVPYSLVFAVGTIVGLTLNKYYKDYGAEDRS